MTRDERAWFRRERKRLNQIKKEAARKYGTWDYVYTNADFELMELDAKERERQ